MVGLTLAGIKTSESLANAAAATTCSADLALHRHPESQSSLTPVILRLMFLEVLREEGGGNDGHQYSSVKLLRGKSWKESGAGKKKKKRWGNEILKSSWVVEISYR